MIRCLILITLLSAACLSAFADGGALILRHRAGSLDISLFAAPSPLRVGPADLSLLIQDSETREVLLDGSVELSLSRPGSETITAAATPGQATNRLLYAATVPIPEAGQWSVSVRCRVHGEDVSVAGSLAVLPPELPILSYWQYFLLVPLAIGLFLLNQALKAKRRSAGSQAGR